MEELKSLLEKYLNENLELITLSAPRKGRDELKVRVTGRSDFDAYKSLSTYNTNGSYLFDGRWVTGYAPSSNAKMCIRDRSNIPQSETAICLPR